MPEIVGLKPSALWLCLALVHLLSDPLRLCAGYSKPGLGGNRLLIEARIFEPSLNLGAWGETPSPSIAWLGMAPLMLPRILLAAGSLIPPAGHGAGGF